MNSIHLFWPDYRDVIVSLYKLGNVYRGMFLPKPRLDPDSRGTIELTRQIVSATMRLCSLFDALGLNLLDRSEPSNKGNIRSNLRKVSPPVRDPLIPTKGASVLDPCPTLTMSSLYPDVINYELMVSLAPPW